MDQGRIGVERNATSIRAALTAVSPGEVEEFEAEWAAVCTDSVAAESVLSRWWCRAYLRLNPPTPDERALMERVRRGDFGGLWERTGDGRWVRL